MMTRYRVTLVRDVRRTEEWIVDADDEDDARRSAEISDGECIDDGMTNEDTMQVNDVSVELIEGDE